MKESLQASGDHLAYFYKKSGATAILIVGLGLPALAAIAAFAIVGFRLAATRLGPMGALMTVAIALAASIWFNSEAWPVRPGHALLMKRQLGTVQGWIYRVAAVGLVGLVWMQARDIWFAGYLGNPNAHSPISELSVAVFAFFASVAPGLFVAFHKPPTDVHAKLMEFHRIEQHDEKLERVRRICHEVTTQIENVLEDSGGKITPNHLLFLQRFEDYAMRGMGQLGDNIRRQVTFEPARPNTDTTTRRLTADRQVRDA